MGAGLRRERGGERERDRKEREREMRERRKLSMEDEDVVQLNSYSLEIIFNLI